MSDQIQTPQIEAAEDGESFFSEIGHELRQLALEVAVNLGTQGGLFLHDNIPCYEGTTSKNHFVPVWDLLNTANHIYNFILHGQLPEVPPHPNDSES